MITLGIILLNSSGIFELIYKILRRRAYLYSRYALWNPDNIFQSQENKHLINPKEKIKEQAKLWMKIDKEEKKNFFVYFREMERLKKKGRFF